VILLVMHAAIKLDYSIAYKPVNKK